tara:strand:+ start:104 stop:691 length:588 start_codon:yes stop_codon:yes gene_type:complete
MSGHLVMLHGYSGTAEMIRPLAEQLCPEEWQVCDINGPFPHPQRGYAWWSWNEKKSASFDINKLKELNESVAHVLSSLPEDGPLIVGGFSQGAAVAQELLLTEVAHRIAGVLVIGSKTARPLLLLEKLAELPPNRMCSMHGDSDEIISLKHGEECANIYEEGGWEVTRMHHNKGHIVDMNYLEKLKKWVSNSAQR